MLRIGKMPGIIMPRGDQLLGLILTIGALRFEEPNGSLAANAIADDANEGAFCEWNANSGEGGGQAGVARGRGG
jgi:hypothetical protein